MLNRKTYNIYLEIFLFILLGLIPRLILLLHNNAGIESDEAIVGLMGKHILEGKYLPLFYYGQDYMGSLEAFFSSISFYFFGISNFSLKLEPLSFSILFIGLSYINGYVLGGVLTGRIAALLVAIAPSPLIIWSLKARGGFIETLFLGSLGILCALILFNRKKCDYIKDRGLWFVLSLIIGLGWWTNNQIIFYICPLGITLLYRLFFYQKNLICKINIIIISLFGFILGSLPFWYHNIFNSPKWSSFEVLFGSTAGGNAAKYFQDYWTTALPIILGARQFWIDNDTFWGASILVYITYLIPLLICLILSFSRSGNYFNSTKTPLTSLSSVSLLVLFLFFVPLIFSLSSFGWLSKAPRYLLPLYSVIPLLMSFCLVRLISDKRKTLKFSSYLIIVLILLINLSSNYLGGITDEGQPYIHKYSRVDKDHTELYRWLDKEGYNHIYTNYWIGYRVAFETNEKVTFTRFGNPRSLRIPEYELENHPDEIIGKVFVLSKKEAIIFTSWLEACGIGFRKTLIGNYSIIDLIKYKYGEGVKLKIDPNLIKVFIPPWGEDTPKSALDFKNMLDGNLNTRWGSGKPQSSGMALEIYLNKPKKINRILIDYRGLPHDMPNSLKISIMDTDSSQLKAIFNMTDIDEYNELREFNYANIPPPIWDIRFSEKKTNMIRLELLDNKAIFDWSINDLKIFTQE
jgi:hypothetical protein